MSLRQAVKGRVRLFCMAMSVTAVLLGASVARADDKKPNAGNLTLTGAFDVSNAYMFRGIRQDDTKLIMWPAADLLMTLHSSDKGVKSATLDLGVWNSLHTGNAGTKGPSGKLWYVRQSTDVTA